MDAVNNDDRRKYARVGFATRVEIIFDTGDSRTVLNASSKDLSQKGVFAKTDDAFSPEAPCTVNIFLTGGIEEISLEIRGRVARQGDGGVGIEFESMDVDVYTHLKNIVRYNSEQSWD
ncbi:MAG: PilZ domain-containing protein [Desulfobacter sp.]|nr:MAG: PilZ domain-containing protein [Desulfobacter sp.]